MTLTKEEEVLKIRFKIFDCLEKGMKVPEISVYLSVPIATIYEQLDYMRKHITTWMFFN